MLTSTRAAQNYIKSSPLKILLLIEGTYSRRISFSLLRVPVTVLNSLTLHSLYRSLHPDLDLSLIRR